MGFRLVAFVGWAGWLRPGKPCGGSGRRHHASALQGPQGLWQLQGPQGLWQWLQWHRAGLLCVRAVALCAGCGLWPAAAPPSHQSTTSSPLPPGGCTRPTVCLPACPFRGAAHSSPPSSTPWCWPLLPLAPGRVCARLRAMVHDVLGDHAAVQRAVPRVRGSPPPPAHAMAATCPSLVCCLGRALTGFPLLARALARG